MNCITNRPLSGLYSAGAVARGRSALALLVLIGAAGSAGCDAGSATKPPSEQVLLQMDQPSLTLSQGGSVQLHVQSQQMQPSAEELAALVWSSSDERVVAVDGAGNVTAVGAGVARVFAQLSGRGTAAADVEVLASAGVLSVLSGDAQTGVVGAPLAQPVRIRLIGHDGQPLAGREIALRTSVAGGVVPSSVTSDADGVAELEWTLGERAGLQAVDIMFAGTDAQAGVITAEAKAGPVHEIRVSPENALTAPGGRVRFSASAVDRFGNVVADAALRWITSDGAVASIESDGTVVAAAEGDARIEAVYTPTAGTPSTGGSPSLVTGVGQFSSVAGAAVPGQVSHLKAPWTASYSVVLQFSEVDDGTGHPADYEVRYARTPMSGFSSGSVVTKGSCATLKGQDIGKNRYCEVYGLKPSTSYDFQIVAVRASDGAKGPASNVVTAWTGIPVQPEKLLIVGGNNQSGAAGSTLSQPLVVRVMDTMGNPMPGMDVQWSVASGGGSVSSATTTTNSLGQAEVRWTLGSGTQTLRASIGSVATTFAANASGSVPDEADPENEPDDGSPSSQVASISVTPSSSTIEPGEGLQLSARARDENGNTMSDVRIQWTSTNGEAATVSSGGYVSGISGGDATIHASADGVHGSAVITVVEYPNDPPPTNSGGSWPNEPSGASVAIDEGFGSKSLADAPAGPWAYDSGWFTGKTASTGGALRFIYGAGFAGGSSPAIGSNDRTSKNFTTYYVGFRVRWSQPWANHPSGTNKVLYWGETSAAATGLPTGQFYVNRRGRYMDIGIQWGQRYADMCIPLDGARNLPDCSVDRLAWTPVDDGQWHTIELVSDASTNGQPNGRLRMWVDGVLQFDARDVRFAPSGTAHFYGVALAPVWGGIGGTKPQTDWVEFDHLRTSGR